ncbi:LytTR family transcriptional regulator DNA-binding domain-containing protein [Flavobacterium sp.]|uniref:ligand-binding sensor domain-containing protein n=1 Tax=Flavobacterium sp. TaxID=239 RepID=UPI0038FCFD4D
MPLFSQYLISFFFLFSFSGISQEKDFQNFTTEEGLPSNEVYSSFQDKNGTMWFATDRGLCQYNGYEFRNFEPKDGLTDITIFEFYPQENEQIWCSTFNGKLFYFKNGTSKFIPYKYNTVITKYIKTLNIPTFFVKSLAVTKQGDLYLSNGTNSFKINNKGTLSEIVEFSKAKISLKTPRYLTSLKVNNKQFLSYFSSIKNEYDVPYDKGTIRNIIFLSEGNKLMISDNIIRLYRKDKTTIDISFNNHNPIGAGKYDSHHFWVGFRGKGFKVFDYNGKFIKEFLKDHSVTKVLKDCYDGIWVATADAGVFYQRINQIKKFTFENSRVQSLTSDKNKNLFIGAFNGNIYQKKFKSKVKQIYKGVFNNSAFVQYHPYLRTTFCYSDNQTFVVPKNYKNPNVGGVLKISDDNDSVLSFSQYGFFTTLNKEKILSDTLNFRIHDISFVDNTLYFGTIDGLKISENGKISQKKQGLFKYRIDDIDYVKSNGIFYMATLGKGVLVYNKSTDHVYAIDKTKGLSNDIVTEIVVEDKHTIWACTNYGINRIHFSDNLNYTIDYITTVNGLLSNQVKDAEIIDDSIYVGTTKGLCVFSKNQFNQLISKRHYFLRIRDIAINDKLFLFNNNLLDLNYSQNRIDFFVEAVSFSLKKEILYQYKLEGLDNVWKYTQDRKISYEYIPPGNYRLLVKVLEDGKSFSNECIQISICISKPFWQTFWFLGFLGLVLGVIIYFFFKIRVLSYNEDIVRELLRLLMKRIKRKDDYFSFKEAGKEIRIRTSDILFVQSSGNYIDIVTVTKTYTVREKIGDFKTLVSDSLEFLRVHRSYIVRIDKINKKSKKAVYINDYEIPVGETYLSELDKIVF